MMIRIFSRKLRLFGKLRSWWKSLSTFFSVRLHHQNLIQGDKLLYPDHCIGV
jgi:hypothetical protein